MYKPENTEVLGRCVLYEIISMVIHLTLMAQYIRNDKEEEEEEVRFGVLTSHQAYRNR